MTGSLQGVLSAVRVTKCHNTVSSFAHKFLTVPVEKSISGGNSGGGGVSSTASGSAEETTPYDPYVLSASAMRTWGYPVPCPSRPPAGPGSVHETTETSREGGKKRSYGEAMGDAAVPVAETVEGGKAPAACVGLLEGHLPTVTESRRILALRPLGATVLVRRSVDIFAALKIEAEVTDCAEKESGPGEGEGRVDEPGENQGTSVTAAAAVEDGDEYEEFRCTVKPEEQSDVYGECSPWGGYAVVAVDCEMCDTSRGLELTRLSLLDGNGKVILDTLVKPYDEITNYREQFSGINAALLSPVSVRFEQAQLAFLRAVSSKTILVGHSLENDLRVLKVCHERCVDTAVILPHPKGYPLRHKLKFLAKEYLHVTIQKGGSGIVGGPGGLLPSGGAGHSSVEDARVALQLMKLKAEMGPSFGLRAVQEVREPAVAHLPPSVQASFIWATEEGLLDMRACVNGGVAGLRCRSHASAVRRCVDVVSRQAQDEDVLRRRHLVYLGLDCDQWAKEDGGLDRTALEDKIASSIATINQAIQAHSAANRGTMLVVSTQSAVKTVSDLQRRKTACTKAMSTSVWTPELEDSLKYATRQAAISSVFLGVSPHRLAESNST